MYLKNIKIQGFKSFADKIDLEIKNGITVVVGPNGSGKSNIVDAIRWVLGEQSIKALRGNSLMSDVIFSGSKSRSALNRASVSLVFDNSDHYLKTDFPEVEIKRTCYRTGENEYYLNNTQVRLKDILELFIDSGAGKESFNIISQGKVSDIINQKPEDRRVIIEEAAGVLKYKKRKEETLRKIEKTNDNIEKINLIIQELETTVNPLREQADVAKKYIGYKNDLESLEIALLATDIKNTKSKYEEATNNSNILKEQLEKMEFSNQNNDLGIEKLKTELLTFEENISKKNNEILTITSEISKLETEKQLAKEREKYEVNDAKLQSNILNLKEEELSLKKKIEICKQDAKFISDNIQNVDSKINELRDEIRSSNINKQKIENNYNSCSKNLLILKNKQSIIEDNIQNDVKLPSAVRNVLNNPKLNGVHNVLGKLIDVSEEYALAIETALGANTNVIVVDNETIAKECINYLKSNNLGRATFFPINIISPRGVDFDTLNLLKGNSDFIALASDVVKYKDTYRGIVANQLGNVILVKDIDAVNRIGKLVKYRYRVISLDGEIMHTGGSLTGGSKKNTNTIINQKLELDRISNEINIITQTINNLESTLNTEISNISVLDKKMLELSKKKVILSEQITQKNTQISEYNKSITDILSEISGTNSLIDDDSKYLDDILNRWNDLVIKKELYLRELNDLKNKKDDLNNDINEKELIIKKNNSEYNSLLNKKQEEEIKLSKYDVKLDNLLNTLNTEYSITFEKAYSEYSLDIDEKLARSRVIDLKNNIRLLGEVNTGAINEYERLNERYKFLTNQKDDLVKGLDNLNEIIISLDETMKEKFIETFDIVNNEFNKVFKQLFKGGSGSLKLTNPDDILSTGIEIIAEPPGKTLKLITLLSGGEMTLTAIALLFAILNIRPVPFCVLDEVEAALDDANVDTFGKYVKEYTGKTQFIIITHKKRTMEYADVLYGITMQESGVSKMVSVKLDSEKE